MTTKYNVMYLEHGTPSGDSWIGYIMGVDWDGDYIYKEYRALARDHEIPKAYDLKDALAIVDRIKKQGDYAVIAPAIIPHVSGSPEFIEV